MNIGRRRESTVDFAVPGAVTFLKVEEKVPLDRR